MEVHNMNFIKVKCVSNAIGTKKKKWEYYETLLNLDRITSISHDENGFYILFRSDGNGSTLIAEEDIKPVFDKIGVSL